MIAKRSVIFTKEINPSVTIEVLMWPNGQITDITNPRNIRFPFVVGQILNMGHKTWACVNGFLVDGKDACGPKKIFGVNVDDVPQGHEWRLIYPNKFKADGGEIPSPQDIIAEAKTFAKDITGFYKASFVDNEEKFLFELAQQANANPISKEGAEKIGGKRLVELALKLYPTVNGKDKFYSAVDEYEKNYKQVQIPGVDSLHLPDLKELHSSTNINISQMADDAENIGIEALNKIKDRIATIENHFLQNKELYILIDNDLRIVLGNLTFAESVLDQASGTDETPPNTTGPVPDKNTIDSRIGKLKLTQHNEKHTIRFADDNSIVAVSNDVVIRDKVLSEIESGAFDKLKEERDHKAKQEFDKYKKEFEKYAKHIFKTDAKKFSDDELLQFYFREKTPIIDAVKHAYSVNLSKKSDSGTIGSVEKAELFDCVLKDRSGKVIERMKVSFKDEEYAIEAFKMAGTRVRPSDKIEWL